eukprot:scaffold415344_cov37-Prasinocladus_malaysianus.AAC.1
MDGAALAGGVSRRSLLMVAHYEQLGRSTRTKAAGALVSEAEAHSGKLSTIVLAKLAGGSGSLCISNNCESAHRVTHLRKQIAMCLILPRLAKIERQYE